MNEISRSYYAIIPANVRYNNRITANAKLLYGEITALCNEKGFCWATNEYFAELYGVSKTSISKWISSLISEGYLYSEIIYKNETKEILNRYLRIVKYPIEEKLNTPIEEKLKDNNTYTNNTINIINTTTTNIYIYIEQNFGRTISPIEYEKIDEWLLLFNEEIIKYAIKIAVMGNKKTFNYVNGILNNWKSCGYKTIKEIEDNTYTNKIENNDESEESIKIEDYDWLNENE